MTKRTSSRLSPFRHPFGDRIGSGKDNKVHEFDDGSVFNENSKNPRHIGDMVVKISTEQIRGQTMDAERAINDAKYKKSKYELLKMFLGTSIPNSSFVVGSKTNGEGSVVPKSYTLQDRVPQYTLADLTPEQRNSDDLRSEMFRLVCKLQVMHSVLDRARQIVEGSNRTFLVEDSLDLGPLSKFVRSHNQDNPNDFNYKHMITGFKASPNLLVDPESKQLSCIDFGQGEWSEDYEMQVGLIRDIVEHDPAVKASLAFPGKEFEN